MVWVVKLVQNIRLHKKMALPIKFRKEDLPTLIAQDLNPCLPKGCRIHVHCKSKPMKKSTWQFKGFEEN